MTKKHSVLILSFVTVLLAVALVVGATYALFSDSATVTNHLEAGTLKVQLYRYSLESTKLKGGELTTETDDTDKSFTEGTNDNIFGIEEGDLIVPGCAFTAGMRIENNGSIAFGYWVEIVLDGDVADNNLALAEQLKLTVTPNGQKAEVQYLSDGLTMGSDSAPVATVSVDGNATFTVSVEFVNSSSDVNNAAQAGQVTFDLIVHAVQLIA